MQLGADLWCAMFHSTAFRRGTGSKRVTDVPTSAILPPWFPAQILLWRRSSETSVRRRNPLLRDPDVASYELLVADEMHTVHLGVYNFYVAAVFTRFVENDVYNIGGGLADHRRISSVVRLFADLMAWRKLQKYLKLEEPVYTIDALTANMFSEDSISTKAAETWGLVPFCIEMLGRFPDLLGQRPLWAAGQALVRYHRVTRDSPRKFSTQQFQDHYC